MIKSTFHREHMGKSSPVAFGGGAHRFKSVFSFGAPYSKEKKKSIKELTNILLKKIRILQGLFHSAG